MILVTGGTGFLGSYLIRYLVRDGFQVRALRRSTSDIALTAEAANKVEWVEGDVLDIPSLEIAFEGVTKVYHLASLVAFNPRDSEKMFKINLEGAANVVNVSLAAGVQKLLYAGSTSAFGSPADRLLIDESLQIDKNTHDNNYGLSKFLGENEIWRGIAEGLPAIVTNPAVLIGAGRWTDSSVRIFGEVAKGQPFYPTGLNGYLDVRDAAKIFIRLMESEITNERFIINAENLEFREVIEQVAKQLGVKPPPFPLNKWMQPVAKIFDAARAFITRSEPVYTSEIASITSAKYQYDNRKLLSAIQYSFTPVSNTIRESAALFKKSVSEKKDFAVLDL